MKFKDKMGHVLFSEEASIVRPTMQGRAGGRASGRASECYTTSFQWLEETDRSLPSNGIRHRTVCPRRIWVGPTKWMASWSWRMTTGLSPVLLSCTSMQRILRASHGVHGAGCNACSYCSASLWPRWTRSIPINGQSSWICCSDGKN